MVREYEHLTHTWVRRFFLVAAGAGAVGVVGLAHRVVRVEVEGWSMAPTLAPGDRLVILVTKRVRAGQVVAVADPRAPSRTLIKRMGGRRAGGIEVLGDDPTRSTDSRSFGLIPTDAVVGRAVYRYAPGWRVGRLGPPPP